MKKILWTMIVLAVLAFTALCLGICNVIGQTTQCQCNLLSNQLTEAKFNPVLMTEIYQRIQIGILANILKNQPTKRHWFVTADTTHNGNPYVVRINIKKNNVKLLEFCIKEGRRHNSLYYNPKNQTIFILEFSYKKPYNYAEFEEWKFWDFKETFPDEAYYSTQSLWFKPKIVWVKIPEIGIAPLSVMREVVDIQKDY